MSSHQAKISHYISPTILLVFGVFIAAVTFFVFTTTVQAQEVSVTGTLYENDGVTPLGAGYDVVAAVGTSTPSLHSTTTEASGVFLVTGIATSTVGTTWSSSSSTVTEGLYHDIVYGNNMYVAVGNCNDDCIITSPDGENWTGAVVAGGGDQWRSVTYGNGLFVAVGNTGDRVMTSPDGVTWTARSAAGDNDDWRSVTYGNGLFVAVGQNSGDQIMTSPDGITWTVQTEVGDNPNLVGVTYGNGLFVAVGNTFSDDTLMTSPDGITWTLRDGYGQWYDVTYGNGLFVAVGDSSDDFASVMISSDGLNWATSSALGDNDTWRGVTYANEHFIAVASTPSDDWSMISTDGIAWSSIPGPVAEDALSVTYGNGRFVAVGQGADFSAAILEAGFGENTPITLFVDANATTSSSTATTLTYGVNNQSGTTTIYADLYVDTLTLTKSTIGSSSNHIYLSDADFFDNTDDSDILFTATTSTTTINADLRIASGTVVSAPQHLVLDGDFRQNGTFLAERGEVVADGRAFDVSSARYIQSTSSGCCNPAGLVVVDGDTKIYTTAINGIVRQHSLAIPGDLSTAVEVNSTSTGYGLTEDITMKPDGTKLYLRARFEDEIVEFDLTTPWDITTLTFVAATSTVGQTTGGRGLEISPDGRTMLIVGEGSGSVFNYTLTTPWDITTAVFVDEAALGGDVAVPHAVRFSADGRALFVLSNNQNIVADDDALLVYSMSTAYDVSTLSYVGKQLELWPQYNDLVGFTFDTQGHQLYAVGSLDFGTIFQYTLDTPQTFTGNFTATSSLYDFTVGDTATASLHTTVDVDGTYINNGAIKRGGGTITLTGSSSIGGNGVMGNLRISGTATSTEGSYTVENLTIDSGASYEAPFTELSITGEYQNNGTATSSQSLRFTGSDAYGVGNMSPGEESLDVSPRSNNIQSLTFGLGGRKLYVMTGPSASSLYEYDLREPYSLSTASYTGRSAPPVGSDVSVSTTGDRFFVLSDFFGGRDLQAYNATSSYDVSTLEVATSSVLVLEGIPRGLFIDHSGTRVYIAYFNEVQQYTLGLANDLNTSTLTATSAISARDLHISDDGTRLSVLSGDGFEEYILTTPWDIATAVSTGSELVHATYGTGSVLSFHIAPAVNRTFVLDSSTESLDEFIMGAEHSGTMTGDAAFGDVIFTSSTTHTFLNNASTSDFTISTNATVTAPALLSVDGVYENNGAFTAGVGTVNFSGVGSYGLDVDFVTATSVLNESPVVRGVFVSANGDHMYVVDGTTDAVVEYSLAIPNDVSSASYVASTSLIATETSGLRSDVYVTPDGLKLFASGNGVDDVFTSEKIYEFTFGSPFDVTSLSFTGSTTLSAPGSNVYGLDFKPDGLSLFITYEEDFSDSVQEYSLSSAFDIATTNTTPVRTITLYPEVITISSVRFASDGSKFFTTAYSTDNIAEYSMSTPWNIDTAVKTDELFTAEFLEPTPTGIAFSADGSQLYLVGVGTDQVTQLEVNKVTRSGDMTGSNRFNNVVISEGVNVFANNASTSNLTINTGAGFQPGESFTISGDLQNNGNFSSATSTIYLDSTSNVNGSFDDQNGFNKLVIDGDATFLSVVAMRGMQVNSGASVTLATTTLTGSMQNDGTSTFTADTYLASERYNIQDKEYFASFSIADQDTIPYGLDFSPDGTKMYVAGSQNDSIYEYDLTSPYNILTASFVHATSVAAQDTNPKDVEMSNDGTKMYVVGDQNVNIYEYSLSSPFDISTAEYEGLEDISSVDSFPEGIALSPDGRTMMVAADSSNTLRELTLSTPFDITTASETGSFDVSSFGTNPEGVAMSPDGRSVFMMDQFNNQIFRFDLSIPFDIETATITASTTVGGQTNDAREVSVDDNGEWVFIVERGNDAVHAYQLDQRVELSGSFVGVNAFEDLIQSGNQTVTFNGSASTTGAFAVASTSIIEGATTTIFNAASLYSFQNVDWQGASTSSTINLRSSAPGTEWYLDVPGSQLNVEYVNVQDSNAGGYSEIIAASSTDFGNNTNWCFGDCSAPAPVEWNPTNFTLYDTITIDHLNIDEDLTDFPVYVDLADLSAQFWSTTPTSSSLVGTDIRITTDSGSPIELPRELVSASSTAQTGELHFKANSISSTTDTVFRVYYNGNTTGDYATSSTYGAQNVWTNDYIGVWHLGEDRNSTASGYLDSTGQGRDGTGMAMGAGSSVEGSLGSAQTFNGSADRISIAGSFTVLDSNFSVWYKVDSGNLQACDGLLFSRGSDISGINVGACDLSTRVAYHWENLGSTAYNWTNGPTVTTDTWNFLSTNIDSSAAEFYNYANGAVATGTNSASHTSSIFDNLEFGRDSSNSGREFIGEIDEVRISSTTRSAAWISAEYTNQFTTTDFYNTSADAAVTDITLTDSTTGQADNIFSFKNEVDAPLFAFQLATTTEAVDVTEVTLTLTQGAGVDDTNLTNLRLYKDHDSDGELSAGDEQVGGVGSVLFAGDGLSGTVSFSTGFQATGTQDYLVTANTSAIERRDVMVVRLDTDGLVGAGVDTGYVLAPTGGVSTVTHIRSAGGGGSGSSRFSTIGAPGDGVVDGGEDGAGEELGGIPNFETPTSNGIPFDGWANGENVYTSDGAYATEDTSNQRQSLANFLYSIPSGNQITGIEIKLEASASTDAGEIGVQLSWDGGISSTTIQTTGTLSTTDTIYTIGGTSDLWGRAWAPDEFTDTNFRVRLVGLPSGGNTVQVDAIRVRIYNQTGGGGSGAGGEI